MNNKTVKLNRDLLLNVLFCYLLSFSVFLSTFTQLVRTVIGSVYRLDTVFMYGIAILLICVNIPVLAKRIKVKDAAFVVIVFTLLILSATSKSANQSFLLPTLRTYFITCVPLYFTAIAVKDTESLDRCLKVMAYIAVLCGVMSLFWLNPNIKDESYSQSFGYMLLPSGVILFREIIKKFSAITLGVWVVSLALLLFSGARGPLFSVVAFSFIYLLIKTDKRKKKSVFGMAAMLSLIAVAVLKFNSLVDFAYRISLKIGVNTRILDKLTEGELLSSSGRNNYYDFVIDYIKSHPLIGSGMINDRAIIANALSVPAEDAYGAYPHNFFLELLMQFGIVIGSVIIIAFLGLLIYTLFGKFKSSYKEYMIMFLFIGFVPLMVSGSYITFQGFYVLLGIMAATLRNGRLVRNG